MTLFWTTDTNNHGLPHDPFKAIVSPRPIGTNASMTVAASRSATNQSS